MAESGTASKGFAIPRWLAWIIGFLLNNHFLNWIPFLIYAFFFGVA
jgi:hypothetical protein